MATTTATQPSRRASAADPEMELLRLGRRSCWRSLCAAVILGWHSGGGTVDPSDPANARHMSRTTAVINSAILVFREGLETILVLAAITASFRGANSVYKRPVAIGGGVGLLATVGTWFAGRSGSSTCSAAAASGCRRRPASRRSSSCWW